MATQITNYQCPACTGPLHFVGSSGKLECEYCGSTYEVAQIEELYAAKDAKAAQVMEQKEAQQKRETEGWDTSDMSTDWGVDADGMRVYNCPSCGAELICDATTAATCCPYCSNPSIVPGQLSGALKPDYVIPFVLSKEDAIQALKNHYKGKLFLPGTFTAENHIQQIQGVYVPFWLFDGEARGSATYAATRSRSYTRGEYRITETSYYHVHRQGHIAFDKVPVDASTKMPDDHMDSIEPFDYRQMKPFSTAYLPGFLADKYDVSVEQSVSRADKRCEETLEQSLRNTVSGYETCVETAKNIQLNRGKVHYALLPVWVLNTKWNGKDFLFTMNGQSGKMAGNLPVSKGKFWGCFAGIAASLSVVGSLLVLLLG